MITLEKHNEQRKKVFGINPDPIQNGIACPECGQELWDTNPMLVLTSYPPRKNIHCENAECGFRGSRIA